MIKEPILSTKPTRLKRDGTGRRTRKSNIRDYFKPYEVYNRLFLDKWAYKTNWDFYHTRDLALGALLYLTSGRINEVLLLRKKQFEEVILEYDDEEDKIVLIIKDFWVSKRKKAKTILKVDRNAPILDKKGEVIGFKIRKVFRPASEHPHPEIPLPRKGELAPFTNLVERYLEILNRDKLFSFGTARAWQIINYITGGKEDSKKGLWNHWFRAQSLSFLVNKLRSTTIVAKDRGISNPATIEHYYVSTWREHIKELEKN